MSGNSPNKVNIKGASRFYPGLWMLFAGFLYFFFVNAASSQCIGFARAVVKPELAPYIHDGNYNATILGEGETIILQKTVFQGQKYRLVVKGVPVLPPVRFRVMDADQVIFDNANHDFAPKWDFNAEITRTLSVEVSITEDEDEDSTKGGCIAVLVGIKPE
jgi:hypothetical protein